MGDDQLLRHAPPHSATRREFLSRGGSAAAGLILLGTLPARRADAAVRIAAYPFSLGVASGDPTPTGVVLWTRLAPLPLQGGGMPPRRVPVRWEVAHDESFRRIARRGEVLALPELGHAVHVEVEGLAPGRTYWYRFLYAGEASPVGRTGTAPAPGSSPDRLAFAFVSCQSYEWGYYTALDHLAGEDIDLVVHLGDYIYEYGPRYGFRPGMARLHNSAEIFSLEDYRNRYALYKSDPALQAAHAAFPFVVTWDDHEVSNDYADRIDENDTPPEEFLPRRIAAYQAYYEHMPLRRSSMPSGPDLRLYRRLGYADLAEFNVLDTRQYRTNQPCGGRGLHRDCPGARDPDATILGAEQEAWLLSGLAASRARWNILANQVPFVPVLRVSGETVGYGMDKWDGYVHSRRRVVEFLDERRIANPVIVTGDVHQNWVAELRTNYEEPGSRVLATEFVGTSISSGGDGSATTQAGAAMLTQNPHLRYHNGQRGYVRCTVTPERWMSDYRVVPYVTRPGAPIHTDASFVVESGRAGVEHT